ncbi:peroxiredoxin-1-like [Dromiciops gliroides]|uniref:peroxiredoxin-1-like n=1 Tax=Dromiciops gliroides TaxID=33562 RepID=UPI001CC5EFAC|nr:peroxiredoxin-1-like [Dromiciops gliroides]
MELETRLQKVKKTVKGNKVEELFVSSLLKKFNHKKKERLRESFFEDGGDIAVLSDAFNKDENDIRSANALTPLQCTAVSVSVSTGNNRIGYPAPHFRTIAAMTDGKFKNISLSNYKGKYVTFFFYLLDFTFVCPTETIVFSDPPEEFEKLNCQVIGASVDSYFCYLTWVNTQKTSVFVCDPKHIIVQDYGVLKEEEGISFKGLFIVDEKGILHQITIKDLSLGHSVNEALWLVHSFHFIDKHGKVCCNG